MNNGIVFEDPLLIEVIILDRQNILALLEGIGIPKRESIILHNDITEENVDFDVIVGIPFLIRQ